MFLSLQHTQFRFLWESETLRSLQDKMIKFREQILRSLFALATDEIGRFLCEVTWKDRPDKRHKCLSLGMTRGVTFHAAWRPERAERPILSQTTSDDSHTAFYDSSDGDYIQISSFHQRFSLWWKRGFVNNIYEGRMPMVHRNAVPFLLVIYSIHLLNLPQNMR